MQEQAKFSSVEAAPTWILMNLRSGHVGLGLWGERLWGQITASREENCYLSSWLLLCL